MEHIINKIQKLLALGERGGTEAEADAAMRKVHELLARHNLSLDDVNGDVVKEEDYVEESEAARNKQPWQCFIWNALARLYFCSYFTRINRRTGEQFHVVIGKPSNITVVKYMVAYLIRTGEELAHEAAKDSETKVSFLNSFKKGYAYRIAARVTEEIAKAKAGRVTDTSTGTALILHPLYDQTKRDIEQYMLDHNLNPRTGKSPSDPSNAKAFIAGRAAADAVSLAGNGVGQNKQLRIGGAS